MLVSLRLVFQQVNAFVFRDCRRWQWTWDLQALKADVSEELWDKTIFFLFLLKIVHFFYYWILLYWIIHCTVFSPFFVLFCWWQLAKLWIDCFQKMYFLVFSSESQTVFTPFHNMLIFFLSSHIWQKKIKRDTGNHFLSHARIDFRTSAKSYFAGQLKFIHTSVLESMQSNRRHWGKDCASAADASSLMG